MEPAEEADVVEKEEKITQVCLVMYFVKFLKEKFRFPTMTQNLSDVHRAR